ncbi:MAG: hypothetical protein WCG27_04245 [Pseudomonadota bacterium]
MKNNSGLVVFVLAFLALCLFYPIPFIADDWEYLYFYHRGEGPNYTLFWLYRRPMFHVLLNIFMPIFAEGHLFLGKFILWSFLMGAVYLLLSVFIPDYPRKFRGNLFYGVLPLIAAFQVNNYEWSFWAMNMTMFPMLTLLAYCFKKGTEHPHNRWWQLARVITYILCFYSFEPILPLALMLELSWGLYYSPKKIWPALKNMMMIFIPVFIIIFVSKFLLEHFHPYPYSSKFGFKWHLFKDVWTLTFLHGYFKTRFLTGAISLAGILLLAYYRFKMARRDFVQKDLLILVAYVLAGAYYYMVMDYNASRALAGHLYYFWGLTVVALTYAYLHRQRMKKVVMGSIILTTLGFFAHQSYVCYFKIREKKQMEINAAKVLAEVKQADKFPIRIQQFPGAGLPRGFNFIGKKQVQGFYLHHILPKDWPKVIWE